MNRIGWLVGVIVGVMVVAATGLGTVQPVAAQVRSLEMVSQSFNVAATGSITVAVKVPAESAADLAELSLALTAYRPLTERRAVADAIAGDLNRNIDTVEVAGANLLHPAADIIAVVVPVEVTTRTPEALQLSKPGLYPLLVELRGAGEAVAELVTFLQRTPSDNERADDDLGFAVAVAPGSPLALDNSGATVVTDAARSEMTSLTELLESSQVPIAVRLEPNEVRAIAATDDSGRELIARLDNVLRDHTLLSAPAYPLDPSLASTASQEARYTQWLRDGEDVLARALGTSPERTAALVATPVSRGGAALIRELGARVVVLSPSEFATLDAGADVDTTQLIPLEVGSGITIDSMVADTTTATLLQRHRSDPALAGIYAVADLLAVRNEIARAGGAPRRHGIVLATADFGLPDSVFGSFATLAAATPGLHPTTLDALSLSTDQFIDSEGPISVTLPESVSGDLGPRVSAAGSLALQSVSTASMLPDDDPRAAEWARLAQLLPTAAFSNDQVDTIIADIRAQHAAILGAIEVPNGFNFNLTDRSGTVRFSLRNTNALPLKVRVRLSSSKLRDSGADQTVVLAPGAFTEVKFDIRARSNGRFPANLELFTPSGDVRLAAPVPITVTITALSGLGNLVTGAGLLVLLSWWLRHLRANRRARAVAAIAHLHPATRPTTLPDS